MTNRYNVINNGFGLVGFFDGDDNPLSDADAKAAADALALQQRDDENRIYASVFLSTVPEE